MALRPASPADGGRGASWEAWIVEAEQARSDLIGRALVRETGHLRWHGGLSFSGETGSEGRIAWEGADGVAGLRPSEAMLASLGACTAMDVIGILAKKRQVVERYEVELEAELADQHPKAFRRIEVVHVLDGPGLAVEAVRRSIELSATRYCIVNATLSSGAVEIHHRYRLRAADGESSAEVVVTGPLGRGIVPAPTPVSTLAEAGADERPGADGTDHERPG